ncbi:hypothetical protein MAM1_0007d00832 [Mucor ambiguus]|uniref:Uncharacterized protein n=1 Tax=Mucor ambiguus TaxID=91626 RepID=A0A0C9M4X1_9FUNG|nr:hypothetical protein MAM1_0007d00832 [Mucor ambiguus]
MRCPKRYCRQLLYAFVHNNTTRCCPINSATVDQITPEMQLTGEQQSLLKLPIGIDDLQHECKRSPRYSSPNSDGIPY